MTGIAKLIHDMILAGVDPEIIGRTAELLADRPVVAMKDQSAELRRERDRERKRLRNSAELAEKKVSSPPEVLSPTPLSPNPPTIKEKTPKGVQKKVSTPLSELMEVLDQGRAESVVSHRIKIRKPLTAQAAKLLAAQMAKCPDPNAAADTMVLNGWQGFNPEWMKNQDRSVGRGSPQKPRNIAEASTQLLERMRNANTEPGTSHSLPEQDVPRLAPPVRQFGPRGGFEDVS